MLYFDMPPTKERYVAEIKNLLAINTRPLCIAGRPRVYIWELRQLLRGKRKCNKSFVVGSNVITLDRNFTYITLFTKAASTQSEDLV